MEFTFTLDVRVLGTDDPKLATRLAWELLVDICRVKAEDDDTSAAASVVVGKLTTGFVEGA